MLLGRTGCILGDGGGKAGGTARLAEGDIFNFRCSVSDDGKVMRKEERTPLGNADYRYSYDGKGHLTGVIRDGRAVEEYLYDSDGRRVEDYRESSGRRHFIYGYDGALIRVNDTFLEWTPKGQLQAVYSGNERTVFEYGDDTRLDTAFLPSGDVVQYVYAKDLMPVRILVNQEPVYEYEWENSLRLSRCRNLALGISYVFKYGSRRMPDWVFMQGDPGRIQRLTGHYASRLTMRIWVDQVGSLRALSTNESKLITYVEYDAFGNVIRNTHPEWEFPLGFAGGLTDPFTGFTRFGFRDYDPVTGRFTTKDPLGDTGGDHDLWDYCVDDPVGCVDNDGLLAIKTILSAINSGANIAGMGHVGLSFPTEVNAPERIITIRQEYDRLKNTKSVYEGYKAWQLWQEDMELREKYKEHYQKYDDFYKDYPPIK